MDFSMYPQQETYYGGSEKKLAIQIGESRYMLKFQKKTPFGSRNNHISEYLGSHIFQFLGFNAQETYLGTYSGQQVVACKNFIGVDEQFVPFNDVGESTLDQDKDLFQYSYTDIMLMLKDNSKLTDVKETISLFWEMFIVDALIGNFDRHGGNWGFLKKDNRYRLAPIFDNGSCMFPQMIDEREMLSIINSRQATDERIFKFPTSQIKLDGKKSSYYEVISSLAFPECNRALNDICERMDIDRIITFIMDMETISELHRKFYSHILVNRYEKILRIPNDSYKKHKGDI
ncbi:MAG: HipA domain-containing protein [Sphaerochaetaceae bacterium]|nr:HipA domain-containing protein [Sphaerochaetaceae bacterium]